MTRQFMDKAKAVKEELAMYDKCLVDHWTPAPKIGKKEITTQVPKINENLQEEDMQIEIRNADSLVNSKACEIKVKIMEGETEAVAAHFQTKCLGDEDASTALLQLPPALKGKLRSQKLIVAVKEKGFFKKSDIYRTEISLTTLNNFNVLTKSLKHEKMKFDVVVKIR